MTPQRDLRAAVEPEPPGGEQFTAWRRAHTPDLMALIGLVCLSGAVHVIGMSTYPNWVNDPGTYLSRAWSVQYLHTLSPMSYNYDHAPLGWIEMGLWSMLTNGFARHATAMDFGNECMLLAKLCSTTLLYLLCRRLAFRLPTAVATVLTFALSPLALHYTRLTYLDNLTTPWLLLAYLLAASPRKHLLSAFGAGFAFAGAALCKETALIVLPGFLVALWQNSDPRTRDKSLAVTGLGCSWMLLYPVYALGKGELLSRPGRNSLLNTALWQLHQRTPTGSVLNSHSVTYGMWNDWYRYDSMLLTIGPLAVFPALAIRRLRPAAVTAICFCAPLFTGGYVPFMHVITMIPWLTIVLFGLVDHAASWAGPWWAARHRSAHNGSVPPRMPDRITAATMGATLTGLSLVLTPNWVNQDQQMMTVSTPPPLRQAEDWVTRNIPRSRTVIVHDSLWTDLVVKDAFPRDHVIIVYDVDSNPAISRNLNRIDYLVLPDSAYTADSARARYPTVLAARDQSIAVAQFGTGTSAVTIYRVSRTWYPHRQQGDSP